MMVKEGKAIIYDLAPEAPSSLPHCGENRAVARENGSRPHGYRVVDLACSTAHRDPASDDAV